MQIEQRQTDLLPELEKMQKKSQNLLSLQDELLQCRKIRRNVVRTYCRSEGEVARQVGGT